MRMLLATTLYPEFARTIYATKPLLAHQSYDNQVDALLRPRHSQIAGFREALHRRGVETRVAMTNLDDLQDCWCREAGLRIDRSEPNFRESVLKSQVRHWRPDVVFVFEWTPFHDDFLFQLKTDCRLLIGQIASSLRPRRTYQAYDLLISSWPPIVSRLNEEGCRAIYQPLGFDATVLDLLRPEPDGEPLDVTFVGGFAPVHDARRGWLEELCRRFPVSVFGYGWELTPEDSPLRPHWRGPVWGLEMFRVLRRSRLTLNLHGTVDVRGSQSREVANNLRLFEATGMGACLITDHKPNLADIFVPGSEVVTFDDTQSCADRIRHYLDHEDERAAIAEKGQARTLAEHTLDLRVGEILEWMIKLF